MAFHEDEKLFWFLLEKKMKSRLLKLDKYSQYSHELNSTMYLVYSVI